MIAIQLDFFCALCGKEDFYIMPNKIETESKDFTRSTTEYTLVCKECKKNHKLTLKIDSLD